MKLLRIALFISVAFLWACSKSCSSKKPPEVGGEGGQQVQQEKKVPDYRGITVQRVVVRELKPGTGALRVKKDTKVKTTYTAWIYDPAAKGNKGAQVLSTDGKEIERVISEAPDFPKGMVEGMMGMKIGAERNLIIPKELAFGEAGFKDMVPPNAILLVNVTVNKILE